MSGKTLCAFIILSAWADVVCFEYDLDKKRAAD